MMYNTSVIVGSTIRKNISQLFTKHNSIFLKKKNLWFTAKKMMDSLRIPWFLQTQTFIPI